MDRNKEIYRKSSSMNNSRETTYDKSNRAILQLFIIVITLIRTDANDSVSSRRIYF